MDLLRELLSGIDCGIVARSVRNYFQIFDEIFSCFISRVESRDEERASDDERYHQITVDEIYKVSQRFDGLAGFM